MIVAGGIFAVLFALVAARALDLAVLRGPALARLAAMQHHQRIELLPHRGPIVDRSGEPLALSVDVPSIYVRPRELRAAGADARLPALATALHMPARALRAKLASSQPFVWLKRQALPREAETVARLELPGVYTVTEGRRFYPHGNLAAHVLGFVGVDSQWHVQRDQVVRTEPGHDRQALIIHFAGLGRKLEVNRVMNVVQHVHQGTAFTFQIIVDLDHLGLENVGIAACQNAVKCHV